jgi:hypothetical protein
MCWNKDISLNTYLFACLSLLFIFVTNSYSKYKSHAFDNLLVYVLLLEVATLQLIEHFLWKNLKNNSMNEFLSKMASFFVIIQPPTVMLMIEDKQIKYGLLSIYVLFFVVYFEFKRIYSPINFYTSVSKTGHLNWEWLTSNGYVNKVLLFIYLFLYGISFLLINNIEIAVMGLLSLFVSILFYFKDNVFGTMWCWSSNLFLFYFLFKILIIQPFYEYNNLC